MRFTLSGQRVVPEPQQDLYSRMLDQMQRSAEAPDRAEIMGPTARFRPNTDAIRAQPYDWIAFRSAKGDGGPSGAVVKFESVGPASTRVSVALGMDVSFWMWLALKLFGRRMGLDQTQPELADRFLGEFLALEPPPRPDP